MRDYSTISSRFGFFGVLAVFSSFLLSAVSLPLSLEDRELAAEPSRSVMPSVLRSSSVSPTIWSAASSMTTPRLGSEMGGRSM